MRSAPAFRGLAIALALLLLGTLWIDLRSRNRSYDLGPSPQAARSTATVAVQKQDITATLGLDGTVTANPPFLLEAPRPGTVRLAGVGPGGPIGPGTAIATVDNELVVAPTGARFVRALVPDGAVVAAGLPIAELALTGFAVRASVSPALTYRIFSRQVRARGQITDGPGPFDCPVLSVPEAAGGEAAAEAAAESSGSGAGRPFLCAVPHDVRAVVGAPATVVIETARASQVLVLPVEAVAGTVDRGEVELLQPGGRRTRAQVELGITDGIVVEIKKGLREGDTVAASAPPLRVRDQT